MLLLDSKMIVDEKKFVRKNKILCLFAEGEIKFNKKNFLYTFHQISIHKNTQHVHNLGRELKAHQTQWWRKVSINGKGISSTQ